MKGSIIFLEEFLNELDFFINLSFEISRTFSKEPINNGENSLPDQKKEKIKSVYKTVINKFFYQESFEIVDLIVEIFWNILIGHKLTNGNKRFATATLFVLINFVNPEKIDENKIILDKIVSKKICSFICYFEQEQEKEANTTLNTQKVLSVIKKWILSNKILL